MKTLVLLFLSTFALFGQCGKMVLNPTTGQLDCVGSGGGSAYGSTSGATDPATCTPGVTLDNWNTTSSAWKYCSGTNTWSAGRSVIGNLAVGNTVPPASPPVGPYINSQYGFYENGVKVDGGTSGIPTTFDCEAYANLNACLDAAKTYVTTNEAGSGLAARVLIAQGTFALSSPPYALNSGMQIIGVMPRLQYVAGQAPDLMMIPNGGTWIDCGAAVCFNGNNLNGIQLDNIGFKNFTKALSFGGDSTKGLAFSELKNLYAIGNSTVNASSTAWELYNCQHVLGTSLNAYKVNTGLDFIQQDNTFQYGNSVFVDLYTLTYAKTAASSNNTLAQAGMIFEVRTPATGTAQALSYVDVYRPQVNNFGGDGTGYIVVINGLSGANAVGVNLYDIDIEGVATYGVYLNYEANSFISMTQAAGTNTFYQAANGGNSTIMSEYNTSTVYNGTGTNVYYGQYAAQASPNPMRGAYWLNSPYGFWVQTDGAALGAATATTPSVGDSTTKVATTAFVAGAAYPVANMTVAVSSATQGANSCSSTSNVTMTGLTTAMTVLPGYSAAPTTYWAATGGMVFQIWPSAANTATWQVCNQTSGSITYPAITFNVGAR